VRIDGVPTRRCVQPASSVSANEKIVTIQGPPPNGSHPLQKAWMPWTWRNAVFAKGMLIETPGVRPWPRSAASLDSFNLI